MITSIQQKLHFIIPELSEMEIMNLLDLDFMSNYSTFILEVDEIEVEPENYQEDVKTPPHRPLWKSAMSCELASLVANNTFSTITDSPDSYVVGTRWVFMRKINHLGEGVKAKARLGAKRFSHREGMDCFDTFYPTPTPASIRLLVAVAIENDMIYRHSHAKQASVQSTLDINIFIKMLPGCENLSRKQSWSMSFCMASSKYLGPDIIILPLLSRMASNKTCRSHTSCVSSSLKLAELS